MKEQVFTFKYDFISRYINFADGFLMYKKDLMPDPKRTNDIILAGNYEGLNYIRVCPSDHTLDAATALCTPCQEGYGASSWGSTVCVSAGILYEACADNQDSY